MEYDSAISASFWTFFFGLMLCRRRLLLRGGGREQGTLLAFVELLVLICPLLFLVNSAIGTQLRGGGQIESRLSVQEPPPMFARVKFGQGQLRLPMPRVEAMLQSWKVKVGKNGPVEREPMDAYELHKKLAATSKNMLVLNDHGDLVPARELLPALNNLAIRDGEALQQRRFNVFMAESAPVAGGNPPNTAPPGQREWKTKTYEDIKSYCESNDLYMYSEATGEFELLTQARLRAITDIAPHLKHREKWYFLTANRLNRLRMEKEKARAGEDAKADG